MHAIESNATIEIDVTETHEAAQTLLDSGDTCSIGGQKKEGSAALVPTETSDVTVMAPRFDYTTVANDTAEKMRSTAARVHSLTRAASTQTAKNTGLNRNIDLLPSFLCQCGRVTPSLEHASTVPLT